MVQSQAMILAGTDTGACALAGNLLIGFNHDLRMDTCIFVSTVPGLRPTARIPLCAYS